MTRIARSKSRFLTLPMEYGVRALSRRPRPQASKSPDGKIWFTTGEGVSVIDPHHLPVNKAPAAGTG